MNLGIDSLDTIAELNREINDLGADTNAVFDVPEEDLDSVFDGVFN